MVAYFMLGVWKLRDTRGGERREMCRLRKEEEERERDTFVELHGGHRDGRTEFE